MSYNKFTYTTFIDTAYLTGNDKQFAIDWNNKAKQLQYTQKMDNSNYRYDNCNYVMGSPTVTTHNWGHISNASPAFSSSYLG
jgi:hypothetical protein